MSVFVVVFSTASVIREFDFNPVDLYLLFVCLFVVVVFVCLFCFWCCGGADLFETMEETGCESICGAPTTLAVKT